MRTLIPFMLYLLLTSCKALDMSSIRDHFLSIKNTMTIWK